MAATSSGQLTLVEAMDRPRCGQCAQPFDAAYPDQKYCSRDCYHASTRQPTIASCDLCGESWETTPWEADNREYCSRECSGKAQQDRVTLACNSCGDIFEERPSIAPRRRYCSYECSGAGRSKSPVQLECEYCGDDFEAQPSKSESRKYCSKKCASRSRFEPDECGHLEEYRKNGDCLRCDLSAFKSQDQATKGFGSPL